MNAEVVDARARGVHLRDLVLLARPRDWLKQVFVLMPLPFALASGAIFEPIPFVLGVAAMCLVCSAAYAFNDAFDAERDRAQPRTAGRPVAAGRLSRRAAFGASATWVVASFALATLSGHPTALTIVVTYALINLAYSLGAKHVPLLDVGAISAGFVLRVVLGCALVGVAPSNWLLLCSSALALFIALGKRRSEFGAEVALRRPSLQSYSTAYLDQTMGLMAGVTLVGYALYAMETPLLLPGREFASLPFVVYGVLEYLRQVLVCGEGAAPEHLLLRSPRMLLAGAGWALASLYSVGFTRLWS